MTVGSLCGDSISRLVSAGAAELERRNFRCVKFLGDHESLPSESGIAMRRAEDGSQNVR